MRFIYWLNRLTLILFVVAHDYSLIPLTFYFSIVQRVILQHRNAIAEAQI